jgi:hypothetical protein
MSDIDLPLLDFAALRLGYCQLSCLLSKVQQMAKRRQTRQTEFVSVLHGHYQHAEEQDDPALSETQGYSLLRCLYDVNLGDYCTEATMIFELLLQPQYRY